jgi:hypothetical protein
LLSNSISFRKKNGKFRKMKKNLEESKLRKNTTLPFKCINYGKKNGKLWKRRINNVQ